MDIFDSAIRSSGDRAGVFEHHGETGYFYLCATAAGQSTQILGAIHILNGAPDFAETDVAVRWDPSERFVALFIEGCLCAVFDADSGAEYGGTPYHGHEPHVPPDLVQRFRLH